MSNDRVNALRHVKISTPDVDIVETRGRLRNLMRRPAASIESVSLDLILLSG